MAVRCASAIGRAARRNRDETVNRSVTRLAQLCVERFESVGIFTVHSAGFEVSWTNCMRISDTFSNLPSVCFCAVLVTGRCIFALPLFRGLLDRFGKFCLSFRCSVLCIVC